MTSMAPSPHEAVLAADWHTRQQQALLQFQQQLAAQTAVDSVVGAAEVQHTQEAHADRPERLVASNSGINAPPGTEQEPQRQPQQRDWSPGAVLQNPPGSPAHRHSSSWVQQTRRASLDKSRRQSIGERVNRWLGLRRTGNARNGRVIVIWDLDETLCLFHSLINGTFAKAHGQQVAQVAQLLGSRWQEAILDLCDDHFFFSQIEDYDQTMVTSLGQHDDGRDLSAYSFQTDDYVAAKTAESLRKLAYRFRHIAALYSRGLASLADGQQQLEQWHRLFEDTDLLTGGWISHGAQLVAECAKRAEERVAAAAAADPTSEEAGVTNVLVTTGQLIPTLGKLLLFRLDSAFDATAIYSARNEGKSACFDAIARRFGLDCNYVVIGDGADERRCAAQRSWPFLKIALKPAGGCDDVKLAFSEAGGPLTSMAVDHIIEAAYG